MENFENLKIPEYLIPTLTWTKHLYGQQRQFLQSKTFQTWFIAGNGSGKTMIVHKALADYAYGIHVNQPKDKEGNVIVGLRICVLVPDFDKVGDVCLEKLHQPQIIQPSGIEVGPLIPADFVSKAYSKDHPSENLKNGTKIWFATSQQPWRQHSGRQFDILLIDEEPDERVFQENVRGLRNAKGGGRIIAGLTPPYQSGQGPSWTKEKIVDASAFDPDITVVTACMKDNPAMTDNFIKQFTKGMSPEQVRVVVHGEYPSWGDLVYPDFQDKLWNPQKVEGHLVRNDHPMPENNEVDWVMAFDWHPSKPCAAIFGWISRDGNATIFDELDKDLAKDKTIEELAQIFKNIEGYPRDKRPFRRWQDPSAKTQYKAAERGFNAWDLWRKVGIVTAAGKNRDQNAGIGLVNEYFRGNQKDHPRVFIYERCKFLRQGLRNHWWKRGEDGIGKPDPVWSDYPVCLRYILQELRGPKPRVKWPYQSFGDIKPKRQIYQIKNL